MKWCRRMTAEGFQALATLTQLTRLDTDACGDPEEAGQHPNDLYVPSFLPDIMDHLSSLTGAAMCDPSAPKRRPSRE